MSDADTANIGTPARMKLSELNTYHKNPRRGDVATIAASMETNGIYRPLIVNKGTHTGRPNEVLAGNHSLKAMRQLAEKHPDDERWRVADVWLLDVDDDRAARIVLIDNRAADLGEYDNDVLLEVVGNLDDDLGLIGTGYDDGYIDALLGANEWQDELPEEGDSDTEDVPMSYAIVVECDTEEQQTQLLDKFIEEGLSCRAIM